MRRAASFLIAAAIAGAGSQAAAASLITEVHFHGDGHVTYATTEGPENFLPPGLVIGAPVHVTGAFSLDLDQDPEFGSGVPADFTGSVNFTAGLCAGATAFSFNVAGGFSGTSAGCWPFAGGAASFLNGHLTGVGLFTADEFGSSQLTTNRFDTQSGTLEFSDSVANWGGEWTLHLVAPEPGAWALMVLGFGGVGAAIRRRRAQAACA